MGGFVVRQEFLTETVPDALRLLCAGFCLLWQTKFEEEIPQLDVSQFNIRARKWFKEVLFKTCMRHRGFVIIKTCSTKLRSFVSLIILPFRFEGARLSAFKKFSVRFDVGKQRVFLQVPRAIFKMSSLQEFFRSHYYRSINCCRAFAYRIQSS